MLTNIQLLDSYEENLEWLNDNFAAVQRDFANKIIAIKNKKIVANSSNIETLLKILKERGIDESEVLIEVISPANEITIL